MTSYKEYLDELYDYLRKTVNNSSQLLKLDSNNPTIEKMDDIINSIINQGLSSQLGLSSKSLNIPNKISYNGKLSDNYRYIDAELLLLDKKHKTVNKVSDFESLLSDVSHYALDLYMKIWELLGNSERKSKNSKYASMTQEELISIFYKVYSDVPKNLLKILRSVDYNGKRILADNYHLQEHNRLLINYLYSKAAVSDYPLLEHLFQKQNLNSYYDKEYSSKRIKDFEDFLNSYK
jgi:phage terminase small subunit